MERVVPILKELALVAIAVVAVDLSAALLALSENPGVVLAEPAAWAAAVGRSLVAKLVPALIVKAKEIVLRFVAFVQS